METSDISGPRRIGLLAETVRNVCFSIDIRTGRGRELPEQDQIVRNVWPRVQSMTLLSSRMRERIEIPKKCTIRAGRVHRAGVGEWGWNPPRLTVLRYSSRCARGHR
jgi:hypothetical protein